MMKRLLFVLCFGALTMIAWADDTQTVTFNGATIEKNVTQITFEGGYIVLHFADGTTEQTEDLASVKIEFSVPSAIRYLNRDLSDSSVQVFDLSGKHVATYKNLENTQLESLVKGVYLVKKGTKTVKLIKK